MTSPLDVIREMGDQLIHASPQAKALGMSLVSVEQAQAILKIAYKGRIQAEVKAAVATETAESEQLKRQVVEARMGPEVLEQTEAVFVTNSLVGVRAVSHLDGRPLTTARLVAELAASV